MANGNFVPFGGRSLPPISTLPTSVAPAQAIAGNGSPEGNAIGNPGQRYTNLLNGDMYIKERGTSAYGWTLVGTAGAGGLLPI